MLFFSFSFLFLQFLLNTAHFVLLLVRLNRPLPPTIEVAQPARAARAPVGVSLSGAHFPGGRPHAEPGHKEAIFMRQKVLTYK